MGRRMSRKRVAVLITGRGSNMAALIEAATAADYPAEIALVVANRADAAGLKIAEAAGVATLAVDHTRYGRDREAFERTIDAALAAGCIELVCLAGFMRLLTPWFALRWRDRLINIHPSLLPSFKGLDTHAQVLASGVRISGCTVHFVRPEMDSGPILVQAAVPVLPTDDEERLAARVLAAEHLCYPLAVRLIAEGRVRVQEDRVELNVADEAADRLISPRL